MGYEYAQKRRGTSAPGNESGTRTPERSFPNSAHLDALKRGAARPTAEDKGHQIELKAAMRAKMENLFGTDFSGVKMYESQTVAEAGANAVAQGNEIAFAPGKTDFSSRSGQALLGHELSHVVSQSRGEVTGGGFLSDSGLEARADREGAMAARGETIYSGEMNGGAAAPLSTASAAPMAGPMQASKKEEEEKPAHGTELIENVPTLSQIKGYGVKPQIATALGNMKSWGKGLGSLFSRNKKAYLHKDWMTKRRKNKINQRMDADMASMMNMDDDDDD